MTHWHRQHIPSPRYFRWISDAALFWGCNILFAVGFYAALWWLIWDKGFFRLIRAIAQAFGG